jgi:hypothetical protein
MKRPGRGLEHRTGAIAVQPYGKEAEDREITLSEQTRPIAGFI